MSDMWTALGEQLDNLARGFRDRIATRDTEIATLKEKITALQSDLAEERGYKGEAWSEIKVLTAERAILYRKQDELYGEITKHGNDMLRMRLPLQREIIVLKDRVSGLELMLKLSSPLPPATPTFDFGDGEGRS